MIERTVLEDGLVIQANTVISALIFTDIYFSQGKVTLY
ncbi:hypothetical protein M080_8202, partial [Bacteroides fragilis str. 3397 T10]